MSYLQRWVGFEESPEFDVKVNTIVDFWSNPCNAPWTVYLETLYPALGHMFIALVDTSLLDIARSYLRPRGGLTRGPRRKKGRRRGRIRGIPDTADLFARMIPGATVWQGMEYGANTRFLWQIDGIIQRGLWYWLVMDATTDGFYWWAQGIKEEGFCKPTNRAGLFATQPHLPAFSLFGAFYPLGGWNISWTEPGFDIFLGTISTPPGNWVVTFFGTYRNAGPNNGLVKVRLNGTGPAGNVEVLIPPFGQADLSFTVQVKGGPNYQLETTTIGTPFMEGEAGILSVQRA